MGVVFSLYFVTRTNRPGRLFEPIGTEFCRLVESEHPGSQHHQELRQIEALLGLDLSILLHLADDVEASIDRLAYEVSMARRHGEYARADQVQAELDEVTRREAQKQDQPPAEGWFAVEDLRRVVDEWREKIAAHPQYWRQMQFSGAFGNWRNYFTDLPPASPDEARLSRDLARLTECIGQARALGETYATFQMQ
jgi:hypothetical protein